MDPAARMGITFYTVRAIYCALTDDEPQASHWANKGVAMLDAIERGTTLPWRERVFYGTQKPSPAKS